MIARVLAICLLATPAYALEAPQQQASGTIVDSVTLEIKEPDGTTKKIAGIPWSLKLTALDAMKMADGIKFTADWYKSLSDWLIVSIDGTQNKGANGPNWGFCVNGAPSGVGVDSYVVGPKATITWVYGTDYPVKCPTLP